MKPHRILKPFKGTQDGEHVHQEFTPGSDPVMLSKGLAAIVVREGWAEPVTDLKDVAAPVPEGNLEEDLGNPAELRETKVVGPEESKPADPVAKKKAKKAA